MRLPSWTGLPLAGLPAFGLPPSIRTLSLQCVCGIHTHTINRERVPGACRPNGNLCVLWCGMQAVSSRTPLDRGGNGSPPLATPPLDFFVFHKFTSFSLVGGLRGGTSLAPHAARAHMRDALPRPGRCNAARRPRSTRHKAGGVEGWVARGRSILVAAVPLHYKWGVCAAHDSSRGRCAPAKLQNCQASDHS